MRSAGRTAEPRRSAPTVASKKSLPDVGEQRIHHVTHVSNLPGILASGRLHADAGEAWGERPTVDISSEDNRAARRATVVAGEGSASVASYVPFFLTPNASLWEAVRAGSSDPRFAPGTRSLAASEFVILVSTIKAITTRVDRDELAPIVVTDGDAADPRTRFATTSEAYEGALRRLIADQDSDSISRAELLVNDAVPFEAVSLIGVPNDRARVAVRALLAPSEFSPRIAVHPPWFAVPTEE